MSTSDSTERRRLALGDRLRLLRHETGLSGKDVADQLGWAASKISRIERARQPLTDLDLVSLGPVLALSNEMLEELRGELRAIRLEEARWSEQLASGHRPVQERVRRAEAEAGTIRAYSTLHVHGLLQTGGYARAVFQALDDLRGTPRDVAAAVSARMQRQQVLYEPGKQFEFLMSEAALRQSVAPDEVLRGQVDRLLAVADLPNLRLGVIPLGVRMPVVVMHDVSVRDDTVTIELGHTELTTTDPADVDLYRRILDSLWSVAVEGDDARALLRTVAARLAGTA